MNYAASLAVVVVLTFFFPLAVRVGLYYDVPRSLVSTTLGAVITFVAATLLIRWQVGHSRRMAEQLELGRAQVGAGRPELEPAFAEATEAFDRVVYGGAPADARAVARLDALDRRLDPR